MLTNQLHPGHILQTMFLRPLKIDVATLAIASGIPSYFLRELLGGRTLLDRRSAIRLGEVLGTGGAFWLEAENEYETNQRAQHAFNAGVTQYLFQSREPKSTALPCELCGSLFEFCGSHIASRICERSPMPVCICHTCARSFESRQKEQR